MTCRNPLSPARSVWTAVALIDLLQCHQMFLMTITEFMAKANRDVLRTIVDYHFIQRFIGLISLIQMPECFSVCFNADCPTCLLRQDRV